jgi:hypothetical protein
MRKILGIIALGLSIIASPLAAQTTAGSGRALKLEQRITDPNGIIATAEVNLNGPRSDAAFPGGPLTDADSAASFSGAVDLNSFSSIAGVGLGERLTTSALDTSAMASASQATGTATVNDLAFSLGTDVGTVANTNIGSLLNITATTVQSTSTATVSPLAATGTTRIENLQLSGSVLSTGTLNFTAEQQAQLAAGTLAPNTVIFTGGGITITLNQQIRTPGTNAITTNAIAVQFTNLPVGTGVKSGELLVASSSASATAAQEPVSAP